MGMPVVFDVAQFRINYPAFADATMYPDTTLENYFDQAECFIANPGGPCLTGDRLEKALNLMTAHLCRLSELIVDGKTPGVETSASVGSVSVGLAAPPFGNSQWSWWLNQTPYGQELQALLYSIPAGGLYIGGSCERANFRGPGGRF